MMSTGRDQPSTESEHGAASCSFATLGYTLCDLVGLGFMRHYFFGPSLPDFHRRPLDAALKLAHGLFAIPKS